MTVDREKLKYSKNLSQFHYVHQIFQNTVRNHSPVPSSKIKLVDIKSENHTHKRCLSIICDKSVTTQNLAFLSYWYRKKRLQMRFEQV
jgi:hypothetical protein